MGGGGAGFPLGMLPAVLRRRPTRGTTSSGCATPDVEAEERALDFARASQHFHDALWFLVHWPDLERPADLVVTRSDVLDGDLYEFLMPAAQALEAKHPLAAALIRRALIDFALSAARTGRYRRGRSEGCPARS